MRITESKLRRIIRSVIRESMEQSSRSRLRNINYEMTEEGMPGRTFREQIESGDNVRSTHAEFDEAGYVCMIDKVGGSLIEVSVEELAKRDPECDLNDPESVDICAAEELKRRGIETVGQTTFPGEIYLIDEFILFLKGEEPSFNVGDKVRVMHVDPPYSSDRQDWGGCVGIISSIEGDVCHISDPTGELSLLEDVPMDLYYLEKV